MLGWLFRCCWIGVALFAVSAGGTAASAGEGDYRIGTGDVLSISVWKDESLTRQVVVLPDGTISFPLIGRVQAADKALEELKEIVRKRLTRYVPDPIISMEVIQVNSLKVYVIGKVNRSGRFDLKDHINVLQALALAGGLNPYAKNGKIKIFRKTGDKTVILPFDYDAVAKGKALEQNVLLESGDVIVVP